MTRLFNLILLLISINWGISIEKSFSQNSNIADKVFSKKSEIVVSVRNNSTYNLSNSFLENISKLNFKKLNSKDFEYSNNSISPDITITILISSIDVSSTQTDRKITVEKSVLANQGCTNRTVPISCYLIEDIQSKTVDFKGFVIYKNNFSEEVLDEVEFTIENEFKNSIFSADGNMLALTGYSRSLISENKVSAPVPSDEELIVSSLYIIRNGLSSILLKNKNLDFN